MFYLVKIRNVCVVLIAIISFPFPCAGQDTSTIKRYPATGTTRQSTGPAQIHKASQQSQTPVKQATPINKKIVNVGSVTTAKTCKSNSDCPTLECWDGFCCDRHCMGKCESCGIYGHEGNCTRVPDGQDPRRACTIVQGGHPACNAACYSGQCMWPDVGKPCEICATCDGTGRCVLTPADDERCGVISCKSQNTECRTYEDIRANRCEALGTCKRGDPANCTRFTEHYSWKDANGVWHECPTGRIMNCYKDGLHLVWQDGAVIRYCNTGNVCRMCKPPEEDRERKTFK